MPQELQISWIGTGMVTKKDANLSQEAWGLPAAIQLLLQYCCKCGGVAPAKVLLKCDLYHLLPPVTCKTVRGWTICRIADSVRVSSRWHCLRECGLSGTRREFCHPPGRVAGVFMAKSRSQSERGARRVAKSNGGIEVSRVKNKAQLCALHRIANLSAKL